MVRITNGTTQKYVTNGAYEDFYKPIGYKIMNDIKVEVNKVINEKPNNIILGVKFSILYISSGILNC